MCFKARAIKGAKAEEADYVDVGLHDRDRVGHTNSYVFVDHSGLFMQLLVLLDLRFEYCAARKQQ